MFWDIFRIFMLITIIFLALSLISYEPPYWWYAFCQLEEFLAAAGKTVYSAGRFLYRVLRPNEDPAKGLVAKDPRATKTVISHVNCGSRPGYKSQYISTSASLDAAKDFKKLGEKKYGQTGLRIAQIDRANLPKSCKVFDLTIKKYRDHYLGKAVCANFAKKYMEVLLVCPVPIPCEVIIG